MAAAGLLAVTAGCSTDPDPPRPSAAAEPTSTVATDPPPVAPGRPAPSSAPTTVTAAPVTAPATSPPASTTPSTSTDSAATRPAAPSPPADADELARRLAAVERRLRADPPPAPAEAVGLGHEHQVLHRALGRHPEWRGALDGALEPAAAARALTVAEAGSAAASTVEPLAVVPAWRVRPPLDPDVLLDLYQDAEAATGTPWAVLAAVHLVETRMGRIVGLSSAGAEGPMQFIPSTWEIYGDGGDPFDDGDAIAAAARLLADRGAPDDLRSALFAYNPSSAYVDSVLAYAEVIAADPWTYRAFWGWQVYLSTVQGAQWLPEGLEVAEVTPLADLADRLPDPVAPPPAS